MEKTIAKRKLDEEAKKRKGLTEGREGFEQKCTKLKRNLEKLKAEYNERKALARETAAQLADLYFLS